MLGVLATRCLIMVFGYAYPAFHCFGMVEKNQANVEELQFWCRYWIIMAIVTTLERITDLLISWSPMYNELKLAFILYLWHPKTKGTAHVYETFLHPFIAQHENHIERKLAEWGDMAWDVAVFYCHHCAILGQAALFKLLHFLASQSEKFSESASKDTSSQRLSTSPTTSISIAMSATSIPQEDGQVHMADGPKGHTTLKRRQQH
ncbi:hypothetical protein SAY86_029934 [Trapa natans]|uniref:HVA22-like protein n=1 Tax=Trapa natans TaxID=22666 RepID=A0AAN7LX70_TRANT|nr:hypothetical protein SAY86_029934 [Trapa natans]